MNEMSSSGGLERAPDAHDSCLKCGTRCLPWERSRTAPTGWMDLFDRQMVMLSSGHWAGRALLGLAVMVLIFAGGIGLVVWIVGHLLGSIAATVTGATALAVGIAKAGKYFLRRRQEPGEEESPADAPPSGPTPAA
ncbi:MULTISPECIES: hypothetical protein [unclassified Nocardia]|uniref:hypothetical protein n=1 Tax=unclassified Nocardia TaxID=2637762 RepID=UPI00278C5582|nr:MULTISPECIES: hypothetical protein [unclassified Nocardia]